MLLLCLCPRSMDVLTRIKVREGKPEVEKNEQSLYLSALRTYGVGNTWKTVIKPDRFASEDIFQKKESR